jgi:hypothetical protein
MTKRTTCVVQIAYPTAGGGIIPLGMSRDPELVRLVARHIIRELSQFKFEDRILNELVARERDHLASLMPILGIEDK